MSKEQEIAKSRILQEIHPIDYDPSKVKENDMLFVMYYEL